MSDQQLAEELHKPIIRKFNKRKVQSPFMDNILGTDLADMQFTSKFNKGLRCIQKENLLLLKDLLEP